MEYRRLNINLPDDLFARIKLLAKHYHVPMSKIMIQLLEMGYLEILSKEAYEHIEENF